MNSPQRRWLLTLASFVVVMVLLAVALSTPPAASWLQRFGRRPLNGRDLGEPGWPAAFDLQDVEGRERTAADLRGRVALVAFGYTHCPDTCPATLARLAAVRRLLGKDAEKVQVVFITIDPERDDALLLGNYVGAFDASFWALRGSSSQIDATARAFHAEYHLSREGSEVLVEHTVDVFLVNPQGSIRDVLPPYLTAKQVADDVHAELREASL
jgi:protein SCO1/2